MWVRGIMGTAILAMVATLAPAARAEVDNDKIDAAADRAVAFLKSNQSRQGYWVYNAPTDVENNIGATSLAGLALLESNVRHDDPVLVAAANNVRAAGHSLSRTYGICLAILFLDRYGEAKDKGLIRTLALRLAAGQNQNDGGWSYQCPTLSGAQETFWMGELKKFQKAKDFAGSGQAGGNASDNSNTQFAVLAMWVARQHGIPVEYPLFKAEWHFRSTQGADGGWGYGGSTGLATGSTPSMTCSGLLGLAVAYGAKREQQASLKARDGDKLEGNAPTKPTGTPRLDIATDPAVVKAKELIANVIRNNQPRGIPHFLYFLWSLERVSVTYKFKDYGGIDWYEYGVNLLLNSQQKNGSWEHEDGVNIDTCFALLFLRKANLVGDISGTARLKADQGDPLKAASSGNTAAKPKQTDPAIKDLPKDKNAADEAKKLVGEFATAKAARQDEILGILQDTKDPTGNFTQALLDLIPTVKDNLQARVRSALAERLSRQSLDSLRTKLADSDIEMRIAAARAMGMKTDAGGRPDTRAMPDLIKLLGHSNESLAAAAEQSLGALTERDFGRNPARWQEFYDKLPPSRR